MKKSGCFDNLNKILGKSSHPDQLARILGVGCTSPSKMFEQPIKEKTNV